MSNQKTTATIFGTRPEIIKLAPLIEQIDTYVFHTGQHKELAEQAFRLFGIEPDQSWELMDKNQTPLGFIERCLTRIEREIKSKGIERIVVQGDTMTALCGALAGALNRCEVVHVEAGLRSFNKDHPWPEEQFRWMIDYLSDYHFAPTKRAMDNLKNIGIEGVLVGNTIVDALEKVELSDDRPYKGRYVLATLHRREAQGEAMEQMFRCLTDLTARVRVVLPMHMSPAVKQAWKNGAAQAYQYSRGITVAEPMDYKTLLWHLKHCEFVMTDSGGIQEEAPSFGKYVLVMRKETERPELIEQGTGELVGWDANDIYEAAMRILQGESYENASQFSPFGDGNTSKYIAQWLT